METDMTEQGQEKIIIEDQTSCEKKELADSVLGPEGGAGTLLTEMSNDELLRFVALDLRMASGE